MKDVLRVISCCSLDREGLLPVRLEELRSLGLLVQAYVPTKDDSWPYTAGSIAERSLILNEALLAGDGHHILCTRGGYGAAELLPLIPWQDLRRKKIVVGFSDVCAIQSALYTKCGWMSLHAPMPASTLWRKNSEDDVNLLIELLLRQKKGGHLPLSQINGAAKIPELHGKLFGGCLTVLTDLIGTPYLRQDFADHILFFEDVAENPGRILRALTHWQQAGLLNGVKAVILGSFTALGDNVDSEILHREVARRFHLPLYHTSSVGHVSPNMPLGVGSDASIVNSTLHWQFSDKDHLT